MDHKDSQINRKLEKKNPQFLKVYYLSGGYGVQLLAFQMDTIYLSFSDAVVLNADDAFTYILYFYMYIVV